MPIPQQRSSSLPCSRWKVVVVVLSKEDGMRASYPQWSGPGRTRILGRAEAFPGALPSAKCSWQMNWGSPLFPGMGSYLGRRSPSPCKAGCVHFARRGTALFRGSAGAMQGQAHNLCAGCLPAGAVRMGAAFPTSRFLANAASAPCLEPHPTFP